MGSYGNWRGSTSWSNQPLPLQRHRDLFQWLELGIIRFLRLLISVIKVLLHIYTTLLILSADTLIYRHGYLHCSRYDELARPWYEWSIPRQWISAYASEAIGARVSKNNVNTIFQVQAAVMLFAHNISPSRCYGNWRGINLTVQPTSTVPKAQRYFSSDLSLTLADSWGCFELCHQGSSTNTTLVI